MPKKTAPLGSETVRESRGYLPETVGSHNTYLPCLRYALDKKDIAVSSKLNLAAFHSSGWSNNLLKELYRPNVRSNKSLSSNYSSLTDNSSEIRDLFNDTEIFERMAQSVGVPDSKTLLSMEVGVSISIAIGRSVSLAYCIAKSGFSPNIQRSVQDKYKNVIIPLSMFNDILEASNRLSLKHLNRVYRDYCGLLGIINVIRIDETYQSAVQSLKNADLDGSLEREELSFESVGDPKYD